MKQQLQKALNRRGFTLVELMVAMSLMLVVGTLGFITFHQVYQSYQQAEQIYIEQEAVRSVSLWVDKMVDTSFQVCIYDTPPTEAPKGTAEIYLYADDAGLYYWKHGDAERSQLTDIPLKPTFYAVGEDGKTLNKAMRYQITNGREPPKDYTIASTRYFPNMVGTANVNLPRGNRLEHTVDTGSVLLFSPASGNLDAMLDIDVSKQCFIATAAYGNYDQRPVMLLRRFRDQVLLPTRAGQWFVDTYYRLSPPLAAVIAQHPGLATLTRALLVPAELLALLLLEPRFLLPLLLALLALVLGLRVIKRQKMTKKM